MHKIGFFGPPYEGIRSNISTNLRWKGTSPTDIFWYQKTRMITLSCDVKISAVCSFISSQSTRVTDGQTNGQNYNLRDRASIAASRGEKLMTTKTVINYESKNEQLSLTLMGGFC